MIKSRIKNLLFLGLAALFTFIAQGTAYAQVEIHIQSDNPDSYISSGISDGNNGTNDIDSFGTPTEGPLTPIPPAAVRFDFNESGVPAESAITYSWSDMTGYSSPVSPMGDDTTSELIGIGFNVNMYGRNNNVLVIHSNGLIYLNNTATETPAGTDVWNYDGPNDGMSGALLNSNTDHVVAGTFNDMEINSNDEIRYKTFGSAPNRIFVVEFYEASPYGTTDGGNTFQIKLYESEAPDTDEDGISDGEDNCPTVYNPGQENRDAWVDPTLLIGGDGNIYSSPVYSPDGTKIAFILRNGENYDIGITDADGENLQMLTIDGDIKNDLAFSPDGTKVAYKNTFRPSYESEIGIANTDGSGAQIITNTGAESPIFNRHNSNQIVYTHWDVNRAIYLININDPFNSINLTGHDKDSNFSFGKNIFSADGTKIVFHTSDGSDNEIVTINTDGTGLTYLTNNSVNDAWPIFSPDGTKIAYISGTDLMVINADGTGQTLLAENGAYHKFSPDSAKIAYAKYDGVDNEIAIINTDGTGQTFLTNDSFDNTSPSFTPDGTKIVFEQNVGSNQLAIVNTDGTGFFGLTKYIYDTMYHSISPNGANIIFVTGEVPEQYIYTKSFDPYDNIGDVCDCKEDGYCTAEAFCVSNGTPDPDCGPVGGLDADYDGIVDHLDNCPTVYNPGQEDTDYITYQRYKIFNTADIFTETGVSVTESSGVFTGTNIEFVCGPCASADFSGTTYTDIGATSGLCTYTTDIVKNIIDNDDIICGRSASGNLYEIDMISVNNGTSCYPADTWPDEQYCDMPLNPYAASSYVRNENTNMPDGIGNACDCGVDGVCAALAYCIEQGTPDPDCDLPQKMWNNASPVNVTDSGNSQAEPRIIKTTDGNYVIGWIESPYWLSSNDSNIFIQKINGVTGDPMWGTAGIHLTPDDETQPENTFLHRKNYKLIADNAPSNTGGVFLAWDSHETSSGTVTSYIQRLDTNGTPAPGWPSLPGGIQIYENPSSNNQIDPHIMEDGDGGIYAAWIDYNTSPHEMNIHVTRLNGNGTVHPAWNTGGTNDFRTITLEGNPLYEYGQQTIVSLEPYLDGPSKGLYVTFISAQEYMGADIYTAQFNNDGSVNTGWNYGNPYKVDEIYIEEEDIFSLTLPDGSGGIMVTHDYFFDNSGVRTMGIKAHRITNTGISVWPAAEGDGISVIENIPHFTRHFTSTDDFGGLILYTAADNGSGTEIYARNINITGTMGELKRLTDETDNKNPIMHKSFGGTRIIPDGQGGAILSYNSFFDSATDDGASHPSIVLQKIDSMLNTIWSDGPNGNEFVVLGNEYAVPTDLGKDVFPDSKAVLAPGSTVVAWQRFNYNTLKFDVLVQKLEEENQSPCGGLTDNESCLSFDIYPGTLAVEYLPETIFFPTKFLTMIAQSSFSNDNPSTPGIDVETGPEDIITVGDYTNGEGFELTLSVSEITNGTDTIPYANIYAVTSYPSSADLITKDAALEGTPADGVVYADGSFGEQDMSASIHSEGNLNNVGTYKVDGSNFDYNGDGFMNPVSLMSTATGHSGKFSQALSLYLEIPANQPEGDYEMAFTLDLIAN